MPRPAPMTARVLAQAAIAVTVLILLTGLDAYRRAGTPAERFSARGGIVEAAAVERGPCAIDHARFGGQRAQLVKVMRGSVPTYVVLEVGRRDPSMRMRRAQWLRAAYGEDVEHIWIGEFSSADAALARAAKLCPAELRCMPGDPGCGRLTPLLTPVQIFLGQ